jgi:hypothetical protein
MMHADLTPDKIAEIIEDVGSYAHDPETAHMMEEDMRTSVLQGIADGTIKDPAACARAALASSALDFPRFCA